ncbi:MAG: hypothetical protein AAFZ74_01830 [Pseudomonadota bacterium]
MITVLQPWIDPRWLYMDTQTVGEMSGDCCHIYDGAMSTLGIMLWASTAAVCAFGALLMFAARQTRLALFGLHGGLVSALLALDDAYLVHEIAAPKLGISQTLFIALIGLAILSYLLLQRRILVASHAWLLGLSLACFGVSVGIDQIVHSIEPVWVVAEDGPKFVGIVAWFLFHLMSHVTQALETQPDAPIKTYAP